MHKKFNSNYLISASELLEKKIVPKREFHVHTNYTDGKANVKQVIEKGIQAGLEMIVFTEHAEPWRTSATDWFLNYVSDIEKFRAFFQNKIKVFVGIEANAISFDGKVELTDQMRENSEFILGAAHRYPGINKRKVSDLSGSEAIYLEYKTLIGLSESDEIDAIAHIGATCTKYCTQFPSNLMREIIRSAAKNGIAVEVNPIYHKPLISFLELCAEEDAMVTFGSNAHGFSDIGLVVRELQSILSYG